jgi:hypothetical protein
MSRNTLSSRLSFVVQSSCLTSCFVLVHPKSWFSSRYQWTMLSVKAFVFHLQCIILSKASFGKNAEAAENGHICQLLSVFQRSVTYSRFAHAAHQAVNNQGWMHACSVSMLSCIVSAVLLIYKILWKLRVFSDFLSSLHGYSFILNFCWFCRRVVMEGCSIWSIYCTTELK